MFEYFHSEMGFPKDTANILIQDHCWKKMMGWCRAAKSEVSGLGLIKHSGNSFEVYDVYILDQKCSFGSTELMPDAVPRLQYELHKAKKPLSDLKFWWHTHYTFNVFWSGTDIINAERLAKQSSTFLLSTVINQAGDSKTRLDLVSPVKLAIDDLDMSIKKTNTKVRTNFVTDIKKHVNIVKPDASTQLEDGWVYNKKKGVFELKEDDRPRRRDWAPIDDEPVLKTAFGNDGKWIIHNGELLTLEEYNELVKGPRAFEFE